MDFIIFTGCRSYVAMGLLKVTSVTKNLRWKPISTTFATTPVTSVQLSDMSTPFGKNYKQICFPFHFYHFFKYFKTKQKHVVKSHLFCTFVFLGQIFVSTFATTIVISIQLSDVCFLDKNLSVALGEICDLKTVFPFLSIL